jgi:hypothetical protein
MPADDPPADVFAVPASSGRVVSVPVHRISVLANVADAGAALVLSIPRIHVAGDDVATCEFLFCAAFEPAGPGTPIISVAGSQSLKGNSRVTRTGLIVENISVASVPEPCSRIRVLWIQVTPHRRLRGLLDTIESAAMALDYVHDPVRSARVAAGILDRVELLSRSGAATNLLAGEVTSALLAAGSITYAALLGGLPEHSADPELWVRDDVLFAGRSSDAATEYQAGTSVLLRVGPPDRRTRSAASAQLRRRLAAGVVGSAQPVAAAPKSVDVERKRRMDALAQRIGIRDDSDVNLVLPVLPVEIEVADDVRPLVVTQRELRKDVEQLIESIREESRYTVGVPIPPLRFRSNPRLLLGTYSIRIHERPVEVGRAYPEHRWCRQSASALAPLALQPIETVDPRTGAYACWLSAADAAKAESAGFRVDDPSAYMIDHTAVTLWNHAHLMTTVDTVASLLSPTPTLLAAVRAAPGGLVRFTSAILALLQERVPVRESKAIANRYLEVIESGMSSTEIAEDLRMLPTVRSSLPGNTPQTPVFLLPRRLEDLVRSSVIRDGSAEVLALKPDAWSRTIADIEIGLKRAPVPRLPIIVILDASLRRFVRLLVSSEFPNLHVLSRREMLYPNALERASLLIDDE